MPFAAQAAIAGWPVNRGILIEQNAGGAVS
jgi:hypothetical protein